MAAYPTGIAAAFGAEIDYAQLVKLFGAVAGVATVQRSGCATKKTKRIGDVDEKHIGTSYAERQNPTTLRTYIPKLID